MESYEKPLRPQRCPTCGNDITQSTDLLEEGASLEPGDFGICQHCGGFLVMDDEGLFHPRSDESLPAWRNRLGHRLSPTGIEQLLEAQRAVRARARLLVSVDEAGERTVKMVSQPEGRKPYFGKN
jgi:hypothetical protein